MGSMFTDQPSLIQEFDPDSRYSSAAASTTGTTPPTPLFLIHDGGGTIFSYHCLGDLHRTVHGIANPRYETGESWAGGIPEMAALYLGFIRSAVESSLESGDGGSRDIIIGGWSLGGLISLEVARQAAAEKKARHWGGSIAATGETELNIIGIVMVDSVCPLVSTAPLIPVVQHAVQWGEHTTDATKERVLACFREAFRTVGEWKLPQAWENTERGRPPPVVLLRAVERVPVPDEQGVARVDIHRLDRRLGWGNYRQDLISKVIDIPGHHFNLFHTEDNLDSTTEAIKKACEEIEHLDGGMFA